MTPKIRQGLGPVRDDARVRREIAEADRERRSNNRWTIILGITLVIALTIVLVIGI